MKSLQLTADVHLQAAAGRPAKVSILAYSGGPMRLPSWPTPIVVDLAASTIPSSIPLLADHQNALASVAGHGVPTVRNGQLFVDGQLAVEAVAGQQILALHKSGVALQASIGAEPISQRPVKAGEQTVVNGRSIVAPPGGLSIVTAQLREVSIVPLGVDFKTTVTIAASKKMKNKTEFTTWAEAMGIDLADMAPSQLATVHANYHGRSEPNQADIQAAAGFADIQASADPVAVEELRLRQIDRATAGEFGDLADQVSTIRASAIGGDLSVDQLITKMRAIKMQIHESKIPTSGGIPAGRQRNDEKIITAALLLRCGLASPEKHFQEQVLDQADRIQSGVSLQTLIMQAACSSGYSAMPGESIQSGNIRQVLTAAFHPAIKASGFSTIAISNVLSNVANKMLLEGFSESPSEWRTISAIKNVKNFKEHSFVRLLDDLEFEELGPAGEIKHGTLGDNRLTGQASTYARMLSITRQDIINDDLSALSDVPRRLGMSAGQKLNSVFWAAFLAADSFFDAANGNVLTGAGTELDVEGVGMTAALKAFRAQRSSTTDGSKLIGGKPVLLMAPPALEINARRLLSSAGIVSGTDGMIPSGNPFAGLCALAIEDRLGDSSFTGYSDAKWYLFRSQTMAPAMLVLALNGRVEPTVETAEADFSTLGIAMRGYSDVGVARGEPLCGLQMAGTPAA